MGILLSKTSARPHVSESHNPCSTVHSETLKSVPSHRFWYQLALPQQITVQHRYPPLWGSTHPDPICIEHELDGALVNLLQHQNPVFSSHCIRSERYLIYCSTPAPSKAAGRWQQQKPAVQWRGDGAWIRRQSAHDAGLCLLAPVAAELANGTDENFVPIETV